MIMTSFDGLFTGRTMKIQKMMEKIQTGSLSWMTQENENHCDLKTIRHGTKKFSAECRLSRETGREINQRTNIDIKGYRLRALLCIRVQTADTY